MRELQLAKLAAQPPEGASWIHEQKFDGYRILAVKAGASVTLWSRNGKDWTKKFASIASAVAQLPAQACELDGEVAAVLPDGRTSFQALQGSRASAPLAYFVFDLLALDGHELAGESLLARKTKLATLVQAASPAIRYSDHIAGSGRELFELACKQGLEGIISKRADRGYTPGRGNDWLKIKCLKRQELVVGGFTEPDGARSGLGALLVGFYEGSMLRFAGKVGTGFSAKMLATLRDELETRSTTACPFSPVPPRAAIGGRAHWAQPSMVVEVAFTEWTDSGRLRHPSFQGIRLDKAAQEVVREA